MSTRKRQAEENTAPCPVCGKTVEYRTETVRDTVDHKGHTAAYDRMRAVCPFCGTELKIRGMEAGNAEAAVKAVCAEEDIVSPSEVEALLKKYEIGARPLSRLLNWGDVTISRFVQAASIPSRFYSDKLRSLMQNERELLLLVESKKDKLPPVTYERVRKRLDEILAEKGESYEGALPPVEGVFFKATPEELKNIKVFPVLSDADMGEAERQAKAHGGVVLESEGGARFLLTPLPGDGEETPGTAADTADATATGEAPAAETEGGAQEEAPADGTEDGNGED